MVQPLIFASSISRNEEKIPYLPSPSGLEHKELVESSIQTLEKTKPFKFNITTSLRQTWQLAIYKSGWGVERQAY